MGESLRDVLAIGLIAAAAIGVCIAYHQRATRRVQQQLSLFKERFAIYRLITVFYNATLQDRDVPDRDMLQLRTKAGTIDFFYEEGFDKYVEELIRRSQDLIRNGNQTFLLLGREREKLQEIYDNDMAWFKYQQYVIEDKFGRYLHCGFSRWSCPESTCVCSSASRLRSRLNLNTEYRRIRS
jgi:hypothetical protein